MQVELLELHFWH